MKKQHATDLFNLSQLYRETVSDESSAIIVKIEELKAIYTLLYEYDSDNMEFIDDLAGTLHFSKKEITPEKLFEILTVAGIDLED